MTEREVLKLALEALEDLPALNWIPEKDMQVQEAITAIKEALAQPEQKPVAWGMPSAGGGFVVDCITPEEHARVEGGYTIPLYTVPPQRTWVGLTHSDIDQGLLRSDYAFKTAEAWRAGVVFAMTKLKQKNGYDS